MVRWLSHGVKDEAGQTLVEYALILMLVALVAVSAVTDFGVAVNGFLGDAAEAVGGA